MPGPTIDDQYWFDLSKKLADSATSARSDAAAKLQTMVVWFWGVYTAAITIGSITSKNLPGYVFALLAAPSVILVLAYWMTVRAQMPADVRFDPRSPDDIQRAFNEGMSKSRHALSAALSLSFLAAVALGVALFFLGTTKETKPEPPAAADFSAMQKSIEHPFVRVTGTIPGTETARIVIQPLEPKSAPLSVYAPLDAKGTFVSNVPITAELKKYDVSVTWRPADNSIRAIVKSFPQDQKK